MMKLLPDWTKEENDKWYELLMQYVENRNSLEFITIERLCRKGYTYFMKNETWWQPVIEKLKNAGFQVNMIDSGKSQIKIDIPT